ncbi:MAG: amidohydrolase [Bacteroidota bacterium]
MSSVTIIRNAMVLTMDADFHFFRKGTVVIEDDQIAAVGEDKDVKTEYKSVQLIDGMGKLVMPGIINAHTHIPMTIFRGYADDLSLHEWLYDYIFPVESAFINAKNVVAGAELAIAEMIKSGTTTFNDMYYFADDIAQLADRTGIRAFLSEAIIDFPAPNSPSPLKGLERGEMLMKKWNHHRHITISSSAHSPYSCSRDYIVKARELSDTYKVPFNIHVAETRREYDQSIKKHGLSPVGYLDSIGALNERTVAAHGVHLDDEDIRVLAKKGVSVAHNPECNMKLASGVAPVPELLNAGVNVGLGTDGVASNNNMDMFEEMNSAAIIHKLNQKNPSVMDAQSVVYMATMGGAKALGADGQIGSLEVGKKADILILDMNQPHSHPVYNIYSLLVYSMRGSDVDTVLIDGKVVMENKQLLKINEEEVFAKVDSIAAAVMQKNGIVQK